MDDFNMKDLVDEVKKESGESSKFIDCQECIEIATKLMQQHPDMLNDANMASIKYLIKTADKSSYAGKCSKATGKWAFLTGYDYVIEIWGVWWQHANDSAKEALILHELLHILRDVDSKGNVKWKIRNHDVEEFHEVVQLYGSWDTPLQALVDAANQFKNDAPDHKEN